MTPSVRTYVRRHRRAVGAALRRAVGGEVPGAVEEEAGPAAVRRVPPGAHTFLVPGFRRLKMTRATMTTFTLPSSAAPGFRRLNITRVTTNTFYKSIEALCAATPEALAHSPS